MTPLDIIAALTPVVGSLTELGIEYVICGSVSSIVHGVPRATADVDVMADLQMSQAVELARSLQSEYYADEISAREAVQFRSSFNAIHLATGYKIDIFVPGKSPFDRQALARAEQHALGDDPDAPRFRVLTAEDTILSKLRWYRLGREISERQMSDVVGVIRVQGEALDEAYMRQWAVELGITDLLDRALAEAGTPLP